MKPSTLLLSALVAFTGAQARADNFVTITVTAANSATVVNRWPVAGNQSGLSFIDGNSGFTGATVTNFFTLTGAIIPAGGDPNGFTSYIAATGAATPQATVGNFLTPNSYAGLTYAAGDLGFGPLGLYAIHHSVTGDNLALIKPGAPTVTDFKALPLPGDPLTPGGSGYFALSYAEQNAGAWGANLFYYLRLDPITQRTFFGSMIPALGSGPIDRWELTTSLGYTDLAYTTEDLGFGYGPNQFYYLRLDPVTQTTFFGRFNPATGLATDIQNLAGIYRTLAFTATNVGFGASNFYTIGRAAQTIAFAPIADRTACDAPFSFVYPTASSGLPVTLAVTGPATVSGGNVITVTGAGVVTLTASQAGDSDFAPAPNVVQSFTVTVCVPPLLVQTIDFAVVPDRTLCDGAFAPNPTASSGLPVTLSVTSGPATVAGGIVTVTGTGNVTLLAVQAGNGTYSAAASVSRTFEVTACVIPPTPQTITFAPVPGRGLCDGTFTVSPTSSSGLPVTLSVLSGPATVSGNTVTVTGTGTVTLQASQAGNGTFSAATSVTQTFVVIDCIVPLIPQVINFPAISIRGLCDGAFTTNSTATSGLPVTLTVLSGPATVLGDTVTVTGTGSVTLQASQAGNGTYSAATSVTQTFNVIDCVVPLLPQVITFPALSIRGLCDGPFTVSSSSNSGLPVTISVLSGPATVSGNIVTPTGTGSVTLQASQAGNGTYSAATSVTQTFTVIECVVPLLPQVITFPALSIRGLCDGPFTVSSSSNSGLPVTISVLSGPATVSGNVVTPTGTGSVTLQASQAGNGTYSPATSVTQTFTVIECIVPLLPQVITFPIVPNQGLCEEPFTVNPTASSGLPVTLTVLSGPATVSGGIVTVTGEGTVTLLATQAGNGTFAGATPVTQTFTAAKCDATIILSHLTKTFYGVPFNALNCVIATTTPAGLNVILTYNGSTTLPAAVGSYTVVATIDDPNYQGTATGTFVLTPDTRLAQTVSFGVVPITDHVFGDAPFTLIPTSSSGMPTTLAVKSGPATVSGNTVTITGAGTVVLEVSQAGDIATYLYASLSRSFNVTSGHIVQSSTGAGSQMLIAGYTAPAGGTSPTYQWQHNGGNLAGMTAESLTIANVEPLNAGIYTAVITSGATSSATPPVILGPVIAGKIVGAGTEVGSNIVHANGNTYDQVLLQGAAVSVTADPGQILRISYIDLTNDIVQVEFSGAGTLSLVLAGSSGPAAPVNYNQPGVTYMKGHASIVIAGANETTNVSVFSVGRITAVNQALFRSDVSYDGVADLASIAILSPGGRFGGLRAANATFFNTQGLTGIYAPEVQFTQVFVGDLHAIDTATPVLRLGATAQVSIHGGDLDQPNHRAVQVSGIGRLRFVDGTNSHGVPLPAQANLGRIEENGADVTSQVMADPGP